MTINILPYGDSITAGASTVGGYRLPLQRFLENSGIDFDYVGGTDFNSDGMTKPLHSGYGGYQIHQIHAELNNVVGVPDIVLLHIGTNDLFNSYLLDSINTRLDALVAAIKLKWPGVKIIISTVGPYTAIVYENLETVNENAALYSTYIESMTGVIATSIVFTDADMYDGIHPTAKGYSLMAGAWYREIMKRVSVQMIG